MLPFTKIENTGLRRDRDRCVYTRVSLAIIQLLARHQYFKIL